MNELINIYINAKNFLFVPVVTNLYSLKVTQQLRWSYFKQALTDLFEIPIILLSFSLAYYFLSYPFIRV